MLFYMRPEKQSADSRFTRATRAHRGVLLIVEILTYRLEGETEEAYRAAVPGLVVDATRIAVGAGAKVLKLPYPRSAEASAAVTHAAQGAPWAVLSAGVDHETFVGKVATAVANGAGGAMAGRALWKNSLRVSADDREALLTTKALPRLRELGAAVDRLT